MNDLLDSLQYPKTLKSDQNLIDQNKFVQPLNDPTSELCFSLDDYVDFGSNFFYQGCHGVVSSLNDDASRRIFTLPGILSVECANFVGNSDRETEGILGSSLKLLPSEIGVVKREIEQWIDFPNEYSYSVVRAFVCVECVKGSVLLSWLIANSPRFGVVIDVAMRDHMSVLFRLCLKAMTREAIRSYMSLLNSDVGANGHKFDPKLLRLKCPVTVEVLGWLASQLSVLYGEASAKSFVIAVLGHLLLNAASHASLFPLDRKVEHSSAAIEQETSILMGHSAVEVMEDEGGDRTDERKLSKSIFVYQIAAAIAALHERSLLEERIRALRNPVPRTAYQRMAEYQYISKKADEERQKRPDYRPLIEHDSLLHQRQHDQETTKMKTREELLAEERDYKRRRMSYRGKKLKRTAKEVMRDIIEEYMEAIKERGGIGGLAKGDAEGATSASKYSAHNSTNIEMTHHPIDDQRHGYRKLVDSDFESMDKIIDASARRKELQEKESYNHRRHEYERTNRERSSRDRYFKSPSTNRRPGQSREHVNHRGNHGFMELDEDELSKSNCSFPNKLSYSDQKARHSASSTLRSSSGRKDKRKLGSPDRHRWKKHENDVWGSSKSGEFSDRYDPSEASDIYDDRFNDSQSTRPEF